MVGRELLRAAALDRVGFAARPGGSATSISRRSPSAGTKDAEDSGGVVTRLTAKLVVNW